MLIIRTSSDLPWSIGIDGPCQSTQSSYRNRRTPDVTNVGRGLLLIRLLDRKDVEILHIRNDTVFPASSDNNRRLLFQ